MRADLEAIVVTLLTSSCAFDRPDRVLSPEGEQDAQIVAPADAAAPVSDGGESTVCDLSGRWIVVQVTFATALGATQKTVSWYFHELEQEGTTVTFVNSLTCGFRVTGTTTVTISDATMEALAQKAGHSVGRQGSFVPVADGCQLDLERTFNLRGANTARFLTDRWMVGDPALELADFPPLPANQAEGMEDWDGDQKEGITLQSGLGPRYVAQRDWNEEHGRVPAGAATFGGQGVVTVGWNVQEKVSTQTSPILQIGATPLGDGYSYWKRVGDELEVVTGGAHPELTTCKNVQRLALEAYPAP